MENWLLTIAFCVLTPITAAAYGHMIWTRLNPNWMKIPNIPPRPVYAPLSDEE